MFWNHLAFILASRYWNLKLFLKLPDQFKPDFGGYTASLYAKLYTLVDKRGWQYIEGEIYIQYKVHYFWKFLLWNLMTIKWRWRIKVKLKLPSNFEESPYVAHIFLPHVIYENVDVVFIEIYRIHEVFWKWFSWKVIHFGLKKF